MTKQCKDCGNTFTMEDGEINFYKSKNLQLPNRCKSCRDKRKATNSNDSNKANYSNNTQSTENYSRNNNRYSGTKLKEKILLVVAFLVFTFGSVAFNETSISNETPSTSQQSNTTSQTNALEFRTQEYLIEHFNKHGDTLGHSSASSYLNGANEVVNSSIALKRIQSDGDTAYFIEATEEFVVVSTDNYIRTYFKPNDGIDYFNRQ